MNQPNDHSHRHRESGGSALQTELLAHLPFSVSSVAIGLTFAGLICYLAPLVDSNVSQGGGHQQAGLYTLFHLFHPMHMFFSAAATTAMFWRYDRSLLKAVVIGMVGSIGVCGVSDIVLPQLSLLVMGIQTPWHVCVIEHPALVLPYAVMGVMVGLGAAGGVARSTLFSHSLHVLSSTAASIFYFVARLDPTVWINELGKIFLFIIVAVMVPCCVSDIVFPLLMSTNARLKAQEEEQAH